MNKFKNKFNARTDVDQRQAGTRSERAVADELPKIVFNFKDFDPAQIPPGQSFLDWQKGENTADLFEKLRQLSALNITEAQQQRMITIYGEFPVGSKFRVPKFMQNPTERVNWAAIKKVGGQKARIAGHVIGNVFYIVFLDADHLFYPSEK